MAKLVSKTYGDALFALAMEKNTIDVLYEEVLSLQSVLNEHEELIKLINHPKIIKEEKIKIVDKIFKNRISEELIGFLTLIVTKDRFTDIQDILVYFTDEVKEYKKIGVAYVTSAVSLSEEQKQLIKKRLLETTDYESMEMHYKVDDTIVAGLIIRIGDRVIDSSVKTKLQSLSKQLYKIQMT